MYLLFTVCIFYYIMWHKTISEIIQHERQTRDTLDCHLIRLFVCCLASCLTHFNIPIANKYLNIQIIL